MTRTQSGANWSDVPSLSHLWMAALLRLAAMFVAGAVSTLQMLLSRLPRACHTDATPDRLPAVKGGKQTEEQPAAAATSHSIEALMVSSEQSSRPSNHEGVLTGARGTSRNSADALLPRAGEAQSARTGERSGPGGGPPHRLTTLPAVPRRTAQAAPVVAASLPRSGEENHARVTS